MAPSNYVEVFHLLEISTESQKNCHSSLKAVNHPANSSGLQ